MKKDAMSPVDYVNPNIGGIGHLLTATSPTVMLPHSMMRIAPRTAPGVVDRYLADKIYDFPIGGASLMATVGGVADNPDDLASLYDHDFETATPYYYSVLLEDYDLSVEYSVTERAAYFRFHPPRTEEVVRLWINVGDRGQVEFADNSTIAGWADLAGVASYFYLELSSPTGEIRQRQSGVVADFAGVGGSVIELKVGLSYISVEQARENLHNEIPGWDWHGVVSGARDQWNSALSKIEVKGGTTKQRTIFYTALYRAMGRMVNITESGRYFSGFDGKVHLTQGHDFYVNDGLWDTYRCMHPLQLLLEPQRQLEMIASYLRMYEQCGWFPSFPHLQGALPIMLGNHGAALIADTYMKGYRDFDLPLAYEALKKNAMEGTKLPWRIGPKTELDEIYLEKGFFPALQKGEEETVSQVHSFERRQAVSVTLEHSYDDWCLAQLAKALNLQDDYEYFMERSKNYRNLYNPEIGFMAPKDAAGNWVEDFDPKLGGGQGGRDYFAECNSWIYTFHVQHDIAGLMELMGGPQAFEQRLDALFTEQYDVPKYFFLKQFPDATGLIGQYAQGNEPSFHIPYLYNYAGAPWKTQRRVRQIMDLWYGDGPLGICGDEDGGAMSSWYVFSAMGMYPVCPGRPIYDLGSPLFEEVRIHLESGASFSIVAEDVSQQNKYIQGAGINGRSLDQPWVNHADIVEGGELILKMGPRPNDGWGAR
ncbi:MAG: glycoside hydrolase family 92 protein [Firmicutes bacterium]|nr:glycoside hydrolase family 92 protein [Bacillota bacterium]